MDPLQRSHAMPLYACSVSVWLGERALASDPCIAGSDSGPNQRDLLHLWTFNPVVPSHSFSRGLELYDPSFSGNACHLYEMQANRALFSKTKPLQIEMAAQEAACKSSELPPMLASASETVTGQVQPRAPSERLQCDYPECTRTYRRSEHLKRHKETSVPTLWP